MRVSDASQCDIGHTCSYMLLQLLDWWEATSCGTSKCMLRLLVVLVLFEPLQHSCILLSGVPYWVGTMGVGCIAIFWVTGMA